ncbi:MAG: hypothetical protein D6815_07370 [Candidatus Dadabacteria bacterium]|nr:MAG: hypothetical protein D6815_07370 [Candidatus Dadabacteria bacterium]
MGDVVRANVLALETDYHGPVNIGTSRETNVVELYRLIKELVGGNGQAVHGPAKPGEVRRSALAIGLAAERLGWKPEVDLPAGLARTVDFFRSRP